MKKKLNCVLLVDDDDDCHFFNQRLLNKLDCTEQISIVNNGKEALDYLSKAILGAATLPELILLDLNMPLIDGWEFLDEFEKMDQNICGKIVIIILTTSIHPADKEKAKEYKSVADFKIKYLSKEACSKLLLAHFPSHH